MSNKLSLFVLIVGVLGCISVHHNSVAAVNCGYPCCTVAAGTCEAPDRGCQQWTCLAREDDWESDEMLGCHYSSSSGLCTACPKGTYGDDGRTCTDCGDKPIQATWQDKTGLTGKEYCRWELVCKDGEYWDGNNCLYCPEYYKGPGNDWSWSGGPGETGPSESNKDGRCIPFTWTVVLNANVDEYAYLPERTNYKTYSPGYIYDAGFGGAVSVQPNKPYLEFLGYFTGADAGERIIDEDGNLLNEGTPGHYSLFIKNKETESTSLYAHYQINATNICYKETESTAGCADQTFDVNTPEESRKVKDVTVTFIQPGYLFNKWKCVNVDGEDCGSYSPGDTLGFSDKPGDLNRILYPEQMLCPVGYYCLNNTKHECPPGSTSAAGSSSIQDCYMSAETRFTDNKGADFTLEDLLGDNAKIYRYY